MLPVSREKTANSKSDRTYVPDEASVFIHVPGGALDGLDDFRAGRGPHNEGELVPGHVNTLHHNFTI